MNDQEYTCQRANVQAFSMGALVPREGTAPTPAGKPQSFLRRLFSTEQNGNTDNEKPDTGEDAKMDEIKALLEKLITLVEGGSAAASGEVQQTHRKKQSRSRGNRRRNRRRRRRGGRAGRRSESRPGRRG